MHDIGGHYSYTIICTHKYMQYLNTYPLVSFFSANGAIQEYIIHHSFNVCWVTKLPQTYKEIQQFVRSLLKEQLVNKLSRTTSTKSES